MPGSFLGGKNVARRAVACKFSQDKFSHYSLPSCSPLATAKLPGQIVETGTMTGVVREAQAQSSGKASNRPNTATGLGNDTARIQGLYVSPPLNPGDYNVEVEAPGFRKVVENVRLEVGARAAANVVWSSARRGNSRSASHRPTVEDRKLDVSNLRTEEAVKDLPLNGRNFAELVGLGAGAIPAEAQIAQIPYVQQRGSTSFAFNGLRYQENRLLLDGIGDNENHNGLAVVIFPPWMPSGNFRKK